MSDTASFTVTKRHFLSALKQMVKLEKSNRKKDSTLEVTLLLGFIRLVIPGVDVHVHAVTKGSAKFTIRLWYIADIVNAEKDKELHFIIEDSTLKLRGFSFNVLTTFFENDGILRSINLPMNYKYLDVVRLYLSEKYTFEELEFNAVDIEVFSAIDKLNGEIDKLTSTMRKYGFNREEVAGLILEKLK